MALISEHCRSGQDFDFVVGTGWVVRSTHAKISLILSGISAGERANIIRMWTDSGSLLVQDF